MHNTSPSTSQHNESNAPFEIQPVSAQSNVFSSTAQQLKTQGISESWLSKLRPPELIIPSTYLDRIKPSKLQPDDPLFRPLHDFIAEIKIFDPPELTHPDTLRGLLKISQIYENFIHQVCEWAQQSQRFPSLNELKISWQTDGRLAFSEEGPTPTDSSTEMAKTHTLGISIVEKISKPNRLAFEALIHHFKALYQHEGYLILRPIAGDNWSMEGGAPFINLAMLTDAETKEARKQSKEEPSSASSFDWHDSHVNRAERVYEHKSCIALQDLSKPLACDGNKIYTCLWIMGAAGSGKSTLFQRIAFDWANSHTIASPLNPTPSSSSSSCNAFCEPIATLDSSTFYLANSQEKPYELVLWVKLRDLAAYLNLEDLGHEPMTQTEKDEIRRWRLPRHEGLLQSLEVLAKYFRFKLFAIDREIPADQIQTLLQAHQSSILYLLDGYDEVASLPRSHPIHIVLQRYLFLQPNLFVTTRPHFGLPHLPRLNKTDFRKIELLGFRSEDMLTYVDRHFKGKEDHPGYEQLKRLLKENKSLSGISHIPVNLEILCALLTTRGERARTLPDLSDTTVTQLYQQLIFFLLRRCWEKGLINQETAAADLMVNDLHLEDFIVKQGLLATLGSLSLVGLITRQLVFDNGAIERQISQVLSIEPSQIPKSVFKLMTETGFLRGLVWNTTKENMEGQGEFLHLTLQEYFAAWYFVHLWKQSPDITIPGLQNYTPSSLIAKYKYHPTFAMTWPFVAGLLALDHNQEPLNAFATALNTQPIELKGWHHEPLLIRCIEQMPDFERLPEPWQELSALLIEGYQTRGISPADTYGIKKLDFYKNSWPLSPIYREHRQCPRWVAKKLMPNLIICLANDDTLTNCYNDDSLIHEVIHEFEDRCYTEPLDNSVTGRIFNHLAQLGSVSVTPSLLAHMASLFSKVNFNNLAIRSTTFSTLRALGTAVAQEPFLSFLMERLQSQDVRICRQALSIVACMDDAAAQEPLSRNVIQHLRNHNDKIRQSAYKVVSGLRAAITKEPFLSFLVELLHSKDTQTCATGLEILADVGEAAAQEPFLSLIFQHLSSHENMTHNSAKWVICRLGNAVAKEPFISFFEEHLPFIDSEHATSYFEVISYLGMAAAKKPFTSFVAKYIASLDKRRAISALKNLGTAAMQEPFLSLLTQNMDSPDRGIQHDILWALRELGKVAAREPFISYLHNQLDSTDKDLRSCAFCAIREFGSEAAKEPLLSLLSRRLSSQDKNQCKEALKILCS